MQVLDVISVSFVMQILACHTIKATAPSVLKRRTKIQVHDVIFCMCAVTEVLMQSWYHSIQLATWEYTHHGPPLEIGNPSTRIHQDLRSNGSCRARI